MKAPKVLIPEDKAIADEFMQTGKLSKTAEKIFPDMPKNNATQKVRNILDKDTVREYIALSAYPAMKRIVQMSETAKNEAVKLAANKDILDRAGFKPLEAPPLAIMPLYLPPEVLAKYGLDVSKGERPIGPVEQQYREAIQIQKQEERSEVMYPIDIEEVKREEEERVRKLEQHAIKRE